MVAQNVILPGLQDKLQPERKKNADSFGPICCNITFVMSEQVLKKICLFLDPGQF